MCGIFTEFSPVSALLIVYTKVMEWAKQNGYSWGDNTCHAAASNGHVEVLEWLKENRYCFWLPGLYHSAVKSENLDVLMWLNANHIQYQSGDEMITFLELAAEKGRLDMLEWMYNYHGNLMGVVKGVYSGAARYGRLDILQWALGKLVHLMILFSNMELMEIMFMSCNGCLTLDASGKITMSMNLEVYRYFSLLWVLATLWIIGCVEE